MPGGNFIAPVLGSLCLTAFLFWGCAPGVLNPSTAGDSRRADQAAHGAPSREQIDFEFVSLAENGETIRVVEMITSGKIPDIKNHIGGMALMAAGSEGHLETVKALIEHGADVNEGQDDTGVNALMTVASSGHLDVARYLIASGANVNATNKYRTSVLMWTAYFIESADMARLLLAAGADVNWQNGRGGTALIDAIRTRHLEVARVLIEHGADVNLGPNRYTPLMFAVADGNPESVALLIEAGADPTLPDEFGLTAVELAKQLGRSEIFQEALQAAE